MFVRNSANPSEECGFTLLELLVAMVLFAIGMLALSAMQGHALKYNSNSYHRSQAVVLAMDMADRMRANRQGVNDNDYMGISNATVPIAGTPPPSCIGATCTPLAMSAFDAYQWLTSVDQLLPNGTGSVACIDSDGGADADPCTDGSLHTITVSWAGRFGATSYSVTLQP